MTLSFFGISLSVQRHRGEIDGYVGSDDQHPVAPTPVIMRAREAYELIPNFSEVARELKVTPGHVRMVFLGMRSSARVTRALESHLRQKALEAKRQKKVAA